MFKKNIEITERQNHILKELEKCEDELSGQDLHRILIQSKNSMGLATVYRNLQRLVKQGIIRSRNLPTGELLYSPVERDIHHLTCVDCGETRRLKTCPVKKIHFEKTMANDFELLFHTLEFFGICQECIQKKSMGSS